MNKIYILGGGTVFNLRPHFALSAPAYGKTAIRLAKTFQERILPKDTQIIVGLTKMAIGANDISNFGINNVVSIGETNAQVSNFISKIIAEPETKAIVMSAALCDFEGCVGKFEVQTGNAKKHFVRTKSGKCEPRLKSKEKDLFVELQASEKIIGNIRKLRKDIFLVGFKTTASATEQEQYEAGFNLLNTNSCNLVVANDVQTGLNMIISLENKSCLTTHNRQEVLNELATLCLNEKSL